MYSNTVLDLDLDCFSPLLGKLHPLFVVYLVEVINAEVGVKGIGEVGPH